MLRRMIRPAISDLFVERSPRYLERLQCSRLAHVVRATIIPLILLSLPAATARAADISVCPSGCDHTTIGAAIAAAAADDVIKLSGGTTYTENVVISKGLTIEGEGPGTAGHATIDALAAGSTVFIDANAKVTLRYVSITGGTGTIISDQPYGGGVYIKHENARVTIESSEIVSNTVNGDGGGIYLDAGRLDLLDSVVTRNRASLGGAGVYNDEGGVLNVERTEFFDNRAEFALDPEETLSNGGALFSRADATISDSHIHDNHATTSGGGIMNRGRGEMTVKNTIIERNTALDGGGVFNGKELEIEGGRLDQNTAEDVGGGLSTIGVTTLSNLSIDGNVASRGAGVYARKGSASGQDGELTITRCSLIGNRATSTEAAGGAILAEREGEIEVELCTISGNEAAIGAAMAEAGDKSKIEVSHSTILNNRSRTSSEAVIKASAAGSIRFGNTFIHTPGGVNCSLRMASLGHNLDGDETCEFNRPTDLAPRAISVEGLADNGGSTRTHALPAGSPAIDAGHPGLCIDHDQRGFGAPVDGDGDGEAFCDIGSFEYGASDGPVTPSPGVPSATPTVDLTVEPTPVVGTPTVLMNPIYLPKLMKE